MNDGPAQVVDVEPEGPRQWTPIALGEPIGAGELVVLSAGWTDDYCVLGICRAMRDIDPPAEEAAFTQRGPAPGPGFPRSFVRHLIASGALQPVSAHEWNVGGSAHNALA